MAAAVFLFMFFRRGMFGLGGDGGFFSDGSGGRFFDNGRDSVRSGGDIARGSLVRRLGFRFYRSLCPGCGYNDHRQQDK